ncbi:uncharacterized protein METZ01_LOCUS39585, partial [marine metagenome]
VVAASVRTLAPRRHPSARWRRAGRGENILDVLVVAGVDDRQREIDMTEVTRALIQFLTTCLAAQARLDDAQVHVHQPQRDWKSVVVVGVGSDNLSPVRKFADITW